jgi:hypothetical protein
MEADRHWHRRPANSGSILRVCSVTCSCDAVSCLTSPHTWLRYLYPRVYRAIRCYSYLPYISRHITSAMCLISRDTILQLRAVYLAIQCYSYLPYISWYNTSVTCRISRETMLHLLALYISRNNTSVNMPYVYLAAQYFSYVPNISRLALRTFYLTITFAMLTLVLLSKVFQILLF